jgi:hypothetical protein
MRLAFCVVILALAGCRTFDPKHPLVGEPEVVAEHLGYWVWFHEGKWHVRMTGGKPHRFQGSLSGLHGGVIELTTTRPELKDRIAVVGDGVQFDVDANSAVEDGFDVQVAGGSCARFDLLVDGKYRPEHVRLGPRGLAARRVPFDRCP